MMEEENSVATQQSTEAQPKQEVAFRLDFDLLEEYYRSYFPFEPMYQWLSYKHNNDPTYFSRREFSLTLEGEVYIRYQMVNSANEFRNLLLSKNPEKIDIGAVFNKQGKKGDDITAVEKEFVIDIDMTDYDEIRTCCSGAKICQKCWKFMRFACRILSANLRDEFGFEHVLWVFSGRRGIHAWVCDAQMRKASDKTRSNVIDYLNILIDNTASQSYVKSSLIKMEKNYRIDRNSLKYTPNPNKSEAFNRAAEAECEKDFVEIVLKDQDLFMLKPKLIIDFLKKHMEDLGDEVEKDWKTITSSVGRYESLKDIVLQRKKKSSSAKLKQLHNILEELRIWLLYPRLDVNVSKSTNHLLKSPFCIHPKTGNVSVPFTTDEIDTFDPFQVPNISNLGTETGNQRMKQCLQIFTKFLENLKKDI